MDSVWVVWEEGTEGEDGEIISIHRSAEGADSVFTKRMEEGGYTLQEDGHTPPRHASKAANVLAVIEQPLND